MERTGVLTRDGERPGGGSAARGAVHLDKDVVLVDSSAEDVLEAAGEVLRSVSLDGFGEDELCRVVAGAGRLKALADALTLRAVSGLEELNERRDYLWRRDGGRDGTPDAVRSNGQRTMDAVFELCTGRDALTYEPLAADEGPRGTRRLPPGRIIAVTAGVVDGTDRDGSCEIIGVGPVPPTVLDSISPDDRLVGAIFGGNGQPLWLGRTERLASFDQYVAVALRDRGCVLCRAPMHRCRIHHIDEHCADEGPTDIENLAALCNSCHLWVHRTKRRVVREVDAYGVIAWSTAPRGPASGERRDSSMPKAAGGLNGHANSSQIGVLAGGKTGAGVGPPGRGPPTAGSR